MFDFIPEPPKVGEAKFKEYLPMLVSQEKISRIPWLEVCVDFRLPVHVMDDVTGEFLFRVPPIAYSNDVITGRGVGNMMVDWGMHIQTSPLHAKRWADKNLTSDLIIGTPPPEDTQAWIDIMNRYGIALPNGPETKGGSYNTNAGVTLEDDLDAW
jgi:hypothetical protein